MAVGVPHPTLGEAVVVCATQRAGGEPVSEDAVREYLHERLASYKVPRRVLFVDEAEVAFTSSQQKVRLEALRALAVERLVAEGTDRDWVTHLEAHAAPTAAEAAL
jgi:acyl-CoA synthetase (AMP-forming)/AMP-acid ligase II